jgi:DNA polymerase-3 subunit gamma/tau
VALALYRKYRSATFAEVIGQDHVTGPLSQALAAGRINHAYLFSGPRGCGKTSSARILARSLNCIKGPTPTPCGVCDSCIELAPNGTGSIDVIEIDAASHGGVDDARDLRERAFFGPVRDRYKVYIIDEAHMVTTQGFNALLKLIEEPPGFLVFVFATTEPDKVLQTIRSRTHHYPFRLIPPGVMRAHLERICADEGVTVEPSVLPLVVRAGGGSARDSLSVLDQLLAGAGAEGVTYADAVGLLGVTDSTLLDDMLDALAAGDAASVYGTVDRVVEAGHDPRRFAIDLLDRFRDLIVLDAVPDAAARGLIDDSADTLQRMADQAARIGGATLTRNAEIVHTALIEMRGTTSPRLVLELLCARMQLPDAAADSAALLQRIERLERRNAAISTEPAEPPASPPAKPARKAAPPRETAAAPAEARPELVTKPAPAPAGAVDAAAIRRLWPEVLDIVKQASRRTRALLDNAQVASLDGDQLTLSATTAPLVKMIGDESNTELLRSALASVVGGTWRVAVELAGAPAVDPTPHEPQPEPDPRDDSGPAAPGNSAAADPEADALSLLQSTLGARPLDDHSQ